MGEAQALQRRGPRRAARGLRDAGGRDHPAGGPLRPAEQRDADPAARGRTFGRAGAVRHRGGQGGKRQDVPLSRTATAALRTWLVATPHAKEFVLAIRTRRGVEKAVKRLCAAAGVQYGGREVHGLRHSAGTRMYVATQDLIEVRDLLRHRGISTTEVYVNYARAGKKKANADW
ncbi:tyrosine-type recombinase/integrase [Deinococcus multiflagellatus]|uniref:Tyrosine-type recombinase/integrase n=1 Tax=Deinococcus multiflagellatus TaxID=1656887 RepID=A0ABW1ZQV6_9DEIO